MKADLASTGKRLSVKIVMVQIITGLSLLILTGLIYPDYWVSVAIGALALILPHSIFAYWVFRYAGATKNSIVAQSFNQGMKLKLITTLLIFVMVFSLLNLHPLPLFGAYIITMVSQWLAMFCLSRRY